MPGVGNEIGFGTLPQHVHRKYAKKGFDFTIMAVGESGLGKSTLINSLFSTDLYKNRKIVPSNELIERTVSIDKKHVEILDKGIKLKITIIDTPGYGDTINSKNSFQPIESYIDEQFNQYFNDESGLNRKNIVDNRVHCCLYFVSPIGRGLTQLDIAFMKRLHQKVNIVPIIAKADTLTPNELHFFKKRVVRELEEQGINIFRIPECDSDEDEDYRRKDREIQDCIPFAVIGSTNIVEVNGRKTRGRVYPWGVVDIQDEQYSDYIKLKTFLSLHMQDLKDITNEVLYENYRSIYLSTIATSERRVSKQEIPLATTPTDKLLQMKEEEIRRMQEQLMQMQEVLRQQSSAPVSSAQSGDSLSPPSAKEEE